MDDNRGSLLYLSLGLHRGRPRRPDVRLRHRRGFGRQRPVEAQVAATDRLDERVGSSASALIGCLLGAAVAGTLSDRFGRKKILLLAALLFVLCAIGSAMPRAPWHLVVARLVGGTGIGITSMLSPMYIAEISPARLRGGLIAVCQLAITIGILAAYFSNYVLAEIAHRSPEFYGTGLWRMDVRRRGLAGHVAGWGCCPRRFCSCSCCSCRKAPAGSPSRAARRRPWTFSPASTAAQAAARELAEIEETIAQESGSIRQLFHHKMRLALLIGITLPFFSQISGINVIMYYGPTVLKRRRAWRRTRLSIGKFCSEPWPRSPRWRRC